MAHIQICDSCRKPTKTIALRLYRSPAKNAKSDHSAYDAYAHIGPCCAERVNGVFIWTPRKVRASE